MKIQKFVLGTVALCLLSACADSSSFSENQNTQGDVQNSAGIYGGDTVDSSDAIYTSTVFLKNTDRNETCSATILSAHTILTAAHCVWKAKASGLVIKFGGKGNQASRAVTQVVMHPQYVNLTLTRNMNDLAILKIAGEMPKGYRPVSLLQDYSLLQIRTTVTVAGYGINKPRWNMGAGTLRKTNLIIGDNMWSQTGIAMTQVHTDHGACFGDSGGPVFLMTKQGLKQFGVANRISKIQKEKNPCDGQAVYTRLDVYYPWFNEVLPVLDPVR